MTTRDDGGGDDGGGGGGGGGPSAKKARFRARVAYRGTPYGGFQLQRLPSSSSTSPPFSHNSSSRPPSTVQGELEDALMRRFSPGGGDGDGGDGGGEGGRGRRLPVVGASRTDAGVHARGQAVHFDLLVGPEAPVLLFGSPLPPPATPDDDVDDDDPTTTTLGGGASGTEEKEEEDRGGGGGRRRRRRRREEEEQEEQREAFCSGIEASMNRMLPPDVRVFDVRHAPHDEATTTTGVASIRRRWHAIASAKSKWYSYRLALGPTLWDPTERYTRTHFVHRPSFFGSAASAEGGKKPYAITEIDVDKLRSILRLYEGTHDFRAFGGQLERNGKKRGGSSSGTMVVDTVRTVYKVELVKEEQPTHDDFFFFGKDRDREGGGGGGRPSPRAGLVVGEEGYYRIDFLLQGALYKMVRNMVGTAMECWLGRIPESRIVDMLRIDDHNDDDDDDDGGDDDVIVVGRLWRKDNPCKPAPPEGLTLECVYYGDGF